MKDRFVYYGETEEEGAFIYDTITEKAYYNEDLESLCLLLNCYYFEVIEAFKKAGVLNAEEL